jgi:two-component system OmpR family response regulator
MKTAIRRTVLVVDDDENQRLLAAVALRDAGFEVHLAADGASAVEAAARLRPDLVLMDVRMPGMDGFTACEQLLSNHGCRNTSVVMLSGDDRPETVVRARMAGAVATVPKMWDWRDYVRTVRELLPPPMPAR